MTENTVTISLETYEALKSNQMYFEANLENRCREQQKCFDDWKEQYKAGCKIAMIIKETRSGGIREIEIHEPDRVAYMLKRECMNQIHELRNQCGRLDIPTKDKWYSPLLNLFK